LLPIVSRDLAGFALVAALALGVGLAINAVSSTPVPLVYKPPAEKLAEARNRGETRLELVTIDKAQSMIGQPDVIILDARPRDFWELGHIPGARSLSREEFDKDYPALEAELKQPGKTLMVYCSDSGCEDSKIVAKRLEELGYPHVALFFGGFDEWENAGLPTEASP
jgi:rhodanese-related sulfurtransferase